MKSYTFFLLLLMYSSTSYSQKLGKYYHEYQAKLNDDSPPLATSAYNRFVTDNFSFTILGATSPTTGIKVETEKPSLTLRGSIYKKGTRFLSTFDLTAGADNNLGKIFSGDKISTFFKANLEGHILIGTNPSTYVSEADGIVKIYRQMGKNKYDELLDNEYNSVIITKLLDKKLHGTLTVASLQKAVFDEIGIKSDKGHYMNKKKSNFSPFVKSQTNIQQTDADAALKAETVRFNKLATKILKDFGATGLNGTGIPTDAAIKSFIRLWKSSPNDDAKIKLVKSYRETIKKAENSEDTLFTAQLTSVNHLWTRRVTRWISFGFSPVATSFMLYNPADSTFTSKNRVLLGGKAAFNYYRKFKQPSRFLYLNTGMSIREMNNLDELTEYAYKKTNTVKVINPDNPSEVETIVKEDPGVGYQGAYSQKVGFEAFGELYLGIWKVSSIPGLYFKSQLLHGKQWINETKLSASAGLMWSVTNKDKDKPNLFTIIPYVKWSNLLNEYEEVEKINKKPLHEQFSIGVLLGIPINIGK